MSNAGNFKDVLVSAGFSCVDYNHVLYNRPSRIVLITGDTLYRNIKSWARTKDVRDGRLPLFTAATKTDLKWVDLKPIFVANMPAVYKVDAVTGLPVFMLAAVGESSDMESVYHLLRQLPTAIQFCNIFSSVKRRQLSFDKGRRAKIRKSRCDYFTTHR